MPQDAFNLRHNARELDGLLRGGKINRVVQPNKDEFLLYIYTGRSLLKLIVCTNASFARMCLTTAEKEPPAAAPNFCMLLRKHLLGAEILSVSQLGFERIIAMTLHCVSDFTQTDRVLYVELMGKYSNAVLTENGVILGALKTTSLEENTRRVLFPGAKYTLPPPQQKTSPEDEAALAAAVTGIDAAPNKARFLFDRVSGLAYPTAAQILQEYERGHSTTLAQFIREYIFEGSPSPCLLKRDGMPADFAAKPLDGSEPKESLQAAQDELYRFLDEKKAFEEKKRRLTNIAANLKKKQEKKLAQIYEKLKESEGAEACRRKGELITANIYRLEKGMSECTVQNYYEEGCPDTKIPLDKTLTPAQNAQKYYRRYAKLKRTVDALMPRKQAEEEELEYTESVLSSLRRAEEMADLTDIEEELAGMGLLKPTTAKKGKKPAEVPFRRFEKDGFTILAGRNNVQNDRLLKSAAPHDIWLHTQKYHSSHVLIVTEGRKVPDEVLEYAARICARYSDGKDGNKIPVDYCERRRVKKPPKAKAGFVIYADYRTILVDPLPTQ